MKVKVKKLKKKLNNLPTITISFFIFNLLLLLIGIAYLGLGSWLIDIINSKPNIDDLTYYYSSLGGITITIGTIVICLAIFGLLISFVKNYYASIVYLIILTLAMFFGVSVGIVGLSYSSNVPNQISKVLNFDYFNSTDPIKTRNVDNIQSMYSCCGVNLPSDWKVFLGRAELPLSCCESVNQNKCLSNYKTGCFKIIQDSISLDLSTTGGICLGIAMPLLIGIVCVIALIVEQREHRKSINYTLTK